jgi:hypothetical protein
MEGKDKATAASRPAVWGSGLREKASGGGYCCWSCCCGGKNGAGVLLVRSVLRLPRRGRGFFLGRWRGWADPFWAFQLCSGLHSPDKNVDAKSLMKLSAWSSSNSITIHNGEYPLEKNKEKEHPQYGERSSSRIQALH